MEAGGLDLNIREGLMRRSRAVLASLTALLAGAAVFHLVFYRSACCPCAVRVPATASQPLPAPPFATARTSQVVALPGEVAPTELAAIGRVSMLLFTPPSEGEKIAKDTVVFWEFSSDKSKVALVPGDWIRPKNASSERFKLVDVVRVAPDVSRFRLVYDVFEDPSDKTKSRRAELFYDGVAKRLPRDGCVLPIPWPEYPKPSTTGEK
jgi:hypothetical protein